MQTQTRPDIALASRPRPPIHRRRWIPALIGAAAVVAAIIATILFLGSNETDSPPVITQPTPTVPLGAAGLPVADQETLARQMIADWNAGDLEAVLAPLADGGNVYELEPSDPCSSTSPSSGDSARRSSSRTVARRSSSPASTADALSVSPLQPIYSADRLRSSPRSAGSSDSQAASCGRWTSTLTRNRRESSPRSRRWRHGSRPTIPMYGRRRSPPSSAAVISTATTAIGHRRRRPQPRWFAWHRSSAPKPGLRPLPPSSG